MSEFGMHLPGARGRRTPQMNVYTGLLFVACVALAVASGFMWFAASKVGLNGNALGLQPAAGKGAISLKASR